MSPEDFYESQARFAGLSQIDQLPRVAWFLHKYESRDRVDTSLLNKFYKELHLTIPPTSVYLPRLAERKPPIFLRDRRGFYLEGRVRRALDDQLGGSSGSIIVNKLLTDLVGKIGNDAERTFLEETIRCYKASAFRAAIVMSWNLAFDHISKWVLADSPRTDSFNKSAQVKYPKNLTAIKSIDDFSEFKEFEIIEILSHSRLITKNIGDMLKERLKRRNAAAHPSSVIITQAQADDVLTDLLNNVVLRFK